MLIGDSFIVIANSYFELLAIEQKKLGSVCSSVQSSQPHTHIQRAAAYYVEFGDQAGVFEKPAGHLAKISHLFNAGLLT